MSETVTVERVARDEFGDPVGSPSSHDISGVVVAPRYSREESAQGEKVLVGLTLYTPPAADIEPGDRVTVRGDDYDVDGESFEWRSLEGVPVGGEVALRRVG